MIVFNYYNNVKNSYCSLQISAFVVGNIISAKLTGWLGQTSVFQIYLKKKISLRVAVADYAYQLICSISRALSQPQAACQHAALCVSDPAVGRPCILGHLTPSKPS